jgi:hypothetical protein
MLSTVPEKIEENLNGRFSITIECEPLKVVPVE